MERVNLREQVAWSHEAKHEDTQMLAEDMLRMGIVQAQKMEPLEPLSEAISRTVLVVGGGVTGISAALEAAAAGFDVVLVEKEAAAGRICGPGLKKDVPRAAALTRKRWPAESPVAFKAVTANPRIKVHCSTRIVKTDGQPGMFDVTLQNGGRRLRNAWAPS